MSLTKVRTPTGGVGVMSDDASLSTYFSIARGADIETVIKAVDEMVVSAGEDNEKLADVFALWMHTRDVRGGKGERAIAECMCLSLVKHYPQSTKALLQLLPDIYGSWKDVSSLLTKFQVDAIAPDTPEFVIRSEALVFLRNRLLADTKNDKPSLAGKWAPREKTAQTKAAKELALACFPESKAPRKEYRQMVTALNAKLSTPEVKMCAHNWNEIDPAHIPAKCLTMKRKACLNQKLKGGGVRYPEDKDRVDFAAKLTKFLTSKDVKNKVHGAVAQPHDLVKDYLSALMQHMNKNGPEVEVDHVIEAQWRDLVESSRQELGDGLSKIVTLADLSTDEGLLPAVLANAILTSECAPPAFANRVLTFAAVPEWVSLELNDPLNEKDAPLLNKVRLLLEARNKQSAAGGGGGSYLQGVKSRLGMSTRECVKDLQGAVKLMIDVCTSASLPAEEVSSLRLLVLSDMAFETVWGNNQENGPWTTEYEAIVSAFSTAGYKVPELIYWSMASKSLSKGESFQLPGLGQKLQLELASDSHDILCGACMAYDEQDQFVDIACYSERFACDKALVHSGDTIVDGVSKHRINIDLNKLPKKVNRLFFSLCSCGPSDLSCFKRPYINLTDGITNGNLCRYNLTDAGKAPSNLLAAVSKVPASFGGGWAITALGDDAKTKCCGNYGEMKEMCSKRLKDVTVSEDQGLASLPVASDTAGVRLLSGFSADMLKSLVKSEEEEEAEETISDAEEALKQAQAEAAAAREILKQAAESTELSAMTDEGNSPGVAEVEAAQAVLAKLAQVELETKAVIRKAKQELTPAAKLRRTLRGERYQPVREVLARVKEGKLASYVAPEVPTGTGTGSWVKV